MSGPARPIRRSRARSGGSAGAQGKAKSASGKGTLESGRDRRTPPEWVRKDGKPVSRLYQEIWMVIQRIPRGRVATYGQVAALAGRPGQPRLVGYALWALPDGAKVPWHRVINARGTISRRAGWSGGDELYQQHLLEREGVRFLAEGRLDLARYRWRPR